VKESKQEEEGQEFFVTGLLVDPGGASLVFTSITVRSADDPSIAPITAFTNREGVFQITCPKAGSYTITSPEAQPGREATFTISPESSRVLNVRTVQME
jgi:hypothetical protein